MTDFREGDKVDFNLLQNLPVFTPHAGPFLDLPNVTSITIDDRSDAESVGKLSSVIKWHRRFMRTQKEVVFSGAMPDVDGIEWTKLDKWTAEDPRVGYSVWCQKELQHHFSTSHVMVWQADGFALDPSAWTDEFFGYDYVGAPFCFATNIVGNGGFSFRSKRFCEQVAHLPDCGLVPEDVYFCIHRRMDLNGSGIRFAPLELSEQWATESRARVVSFDGRFGFHGKHLFSLAGAKISRYIPDGARCFVSGLVWDGKKLIRPK